MNIIWESYNFDTDQTWQADGQTLSKSYQQTTLVGNED